METFPYTATQGIGDQLIPVFASLPAMCGGKRERFAP